MRELSERGYRMAILTNNVREWEELWRSKLPVDEIFELVVDSAWVGMRKPEPEIYTLTIDRLDGPGARAVPVRRRQRAERRGGARPRADAVHFQSNEQAIPEIRAALGLDAAA